MSFCHSVQAKRDMESSDFGVLSVVDRQQDTFSCVAKKKISKKKATPLPLISLGLSAAYRATAELAFTALKQSSPPAICWLKPQARQGDESQNHATTKPLALEGRGVGGEGAPSSVAR